MKQLHTHHMPSDISQDQFSLFRQMVDGWIERCDCVSWQVSCHFDTRGHSYPNKMKLRDHSLTSCCRDYNMVSDYSWFPQEAPEFTSRQALALWRNKYHYLSTHVWKHISKYKVANVFDKYKVREDMKMQIFILFHKLVHKLLLGKRCLTFKSALSVCGLVASHFHIIYRL